VATVVQLLRLALAKRSDCLRRLSLMLSDRRNPQAIEAAAD
jgi:hypothetical protein